jgi:hypothetical protein
MTSTSTVPAPAGWYLPTPDVLDTAADRIAAAGLHPAFWRDGVLVREPWPDAQAQPYRPGLRLSMPGAIGVARGLRREADITAHIVPCTVDPDEPCDPAVMALWEHIGGDCLQHLWRWSDSSTGLHIAATMRDCAAWLRETGAAA